MKKCYRCVKKLVASPQFHTMLFVILIVGIAGMNVYAQNSNSAEDTATNLYNYVYQKLRWPASSFAMVIAGGYWKFSQNGRRTALQIAAGVLIWALVPFWISLAKLVTGS
jgi:cell division protein FtsW (lipid II flippase)